MITADEVRVDVDLLSIQREQVQLSTEPVHYINNAQANIRLLLYRSLFGSL